MKRRRPALLLLVVLAAVGVDAEARRAPGPGGGVVVSVSTELMPAVIEAHVFAPLLVPRDSAALEAPPLAGAPDHASSVLAKVAHDSSGRRWRLEALAPAIDVATAVSRCLQGRAERGFAADALRAAGVIAEVSVQGNDVVIAFSKAVFVVPELLAFCPLRPASNAPTGPYALSGPGRLSWRSGSYEAPPLLGAIELRSPVTSGADRADVIVAPTADPRNGAGATLLGPWPDVIALVQSPRTRSDDPFGLSDDNAGTLAFRQALRADLLAAAWSSGRGGPTQALLPPGVAPARPLPPAEGVSSTPLSLAPVPKDAPRLPLTMIDADLLTDAVGERLAVLLRGRGWLLELRRASSAIAEGAELVRWRPPTRDAALSLLSFVGEREGLLADDNVKRALADPRLLVADDAARLAAALALERALLDSRLVVPLIVVERAMLVDPDLRGVVIRGDGVPIFDGAWWGGGR